MSITERLMATVGAEAVFRDMGFDTSAVSPSGMILCAFHDDGRNPSCSIDIPAGIFHCFGCGKSGDLVSGWGLAKGIDYGPALFKAIEERFLANGHALPSVPPAPRLPAVVTDPVALDARLASVLAAAEPVPTAPEICALYEVRRFKTPKSSGLLYPVRDPSTGLLCDIKRRQLNPVPDPRFKSVSATPYCTVCSAPHPRTHPLFKDHAAHLLRAHAGLFGYKALLANPSHRPLLLAGEKDALRGATALLSLGIVPISWSAGEASDPEGLAPLIKDRPTTILYDADEAGVREAPLREAFLVRQGAVAAVFPWASVPPPALVPPQKDLFDWLKAGGSPSALASAILGRPVEPPAVLPPPPAPPAPPKPKAPPKPRLEVPAAPPAPVGDSPLDLDDPMGTAGHFVLARFHNGSRPTLVRWRGDFWVWRGTRYTVSEDEGIRAALYNFLRASGETPSDRIVSKVIDALKAVVYAATDTNPPVWLDRSAATPSDRLVAFANVLYDPLTNTTHPHSPAYYNHSALPFPYDPAAPEPEAWLRFLQDLWSDDPDSIALLQEIMGYLIGPDTHFQKFFYLYGQPGCGKGTIGRVIRHVLGPENCGAQQLAAFEQNFGLQDLIGKSAAILDDVRWSPKADNQRITQTILSISGEGALTIDRKNMAPWTGYLGARLILISNELIKLPDVASALTRRIVPLHFRRSFKGREDTELTARLFTEATGILNWALEGRARLFERGAFLIRGKSLALHARFEAATNPLRSFQAECCEFTIGPNGDGGEGDSVNSLYSVYAKWCEDSGVEHPLTKQDFENKMIDSSPMISAEYDRALGRRNFRGVRLLNGALDSLYRSEPSGGGSPSYRRG